MDSTNLPRECNAVRRSCVPPPPYRHYRHCPPPRPFASVRFDPLAWSSGSDQRRISGCGIRWLLAGPDSLPLWLCRVCAFVLLRCFSCSHTVLPKEHSLGVIFFSSLSSCKCCIFLQFYLHFTTDYTCMIVYVTNNKEPEPDIGGPQRKPTISDYTELTKFCQKLIILRFYNIHLFYKLNFL